MDVELGLVVTAVGKNKSIKHLYMGRNLLNMKAKHIATVMESVVQLVQEEDCVLQSLMLPDSRLKSDLYNLINALGSNQCLQTIDIRYGFLIFIKVTTYSISCHLQFLFLVEMQWEMEVPGYLQKLFKLTLESEPSTTIEII